MAQNWLRQLWWCSEVREGRGAAHAALDGHEDDLARLVREQRGMLHGFVHRSVMIRH